MGTQSYNSGIGFIELVQSTDGEPIIEIDEFGLIKRIEDSEIIEDNMDFQIEMLLEQESAIKETKGEAMSILVDGILSSVQTDNNDTLKEIKELKKAKDALACNLEEEADLTRCRLTALADQKDKVMAKIIQ